MSNQITLDEYLRLCVYATYPLSQETRDLLNRNKIPNRFFDINFPEARCWVIGSGAWNSVPKWRRISRLEFRIFMMNMLKIAKQLVIIII